MSFDNRWTISSSYDFHPHQQHSQRRGYFSQTALLGIEVLPDMSPAVPGLSPGWRDACNSMTEGTRFSQSG